MFGCVGAVVENLEKAFEAAPIRSAQRLFTVGGDIVGSANWFYDRRTQYLHKKLIPIFLISGVPHLDVSVYAGKNVDWKIDVPEAADLTTMIPHLTASLMESLAAGWAQLHSCLRQATPTIYVGAPIATPMMSGSPRVAG
jgi:hypothetical protein